MIAQAKVPLRAPSRIATTRVPSSSTSLHSSSRLCTTNHPSPTLANPHSIMPVDPTYLSSAAGGYYFGMYPRRRTRLRNLNTGGMHNFGPRRVRGTGDYLTARAANPRTGLISPSVYTPSAASEAEPATETASQPAPKSAPEPKSDSDGKRPSMQRPQQLPPRCGHKAHKRCDDGIVSNPWYVESFFSLGFRRLYLSSIFALYATKRI